MIIGPHVIPLRIIHAVPPDRAWHGANPAHAAPPRVLCEQTIARLAALNAVARRLREWGLAIAEQQLEGEWPARNQPLVRLRRDPARSIAPLLDATRDRSWLSIGRGPTTAHAELDGVMVVWEVQ